MSFEEEAANVGTSYTDVEYGDYLSARSITAFVVWSNVFDCVSINQLIIVSIRLCEGSSHTYF